MGQHITEQTPRSVCVDFDRAPAQNPRSVNNRAGAVSGKNRHSRILAIIRVYGG